MFDLLKLLGYSGYLVGNSVCGTCDILRYINCFVNTFFFLTEMHGLLSLTVRPIHIQRISALKAIRYFSKTTQPLRCKVEVGKEAKSLVEKAARKLDPFSAVQNEPTAKFVAFKEFINVKKRILRN